MGCIVEKVVLKNGEPSKLFEALSKEMSSAAALETYLELKSNADAYTKMFGINEQGEVDHEAYLSRPKYKLAQFKTTQEQKDVMDVLADKFIYAMRTIPGTYSTYKLGNFDISALAKKPGAMLEVIQAVRQSIFMDTIKGDNQSAERQELLRNAATDLPNFLGRYNPATDKTELGPLGELLNTLGVPIRIKDTYTEVEVIDYTDDALEVEEDSQGQKSAEDVEVQYERIYDMDILETSPLNSVLPELRIYLRNLRKVRPDYIYDPVQTAADLTTSRGRDKIFETGALGFHRPSDSTNIRKLMGILKGTQDMADMGARLKRSLKNHPEFIPLYENLMDEGFIDVPVLGRYSKLGTALFSLAKADYDMISQVETIKDDLVVMDSNRFKLKNIMTARWAENILGIQEGSMTAKKNNTAKFISPRRANTPKEISDAARNKTTLVAKVNPVIAGLNAQEGEYIHEASNHFQDAGFKDIDIQSVKNLIRLVQDNPKRFHNDTKVPTPYTIIKTILDKVAINGVYKGDDVFAKNSNEFGENRYIKLLAESASEHNLDIHVGSHLSGRGTVVHAYNASSEAQAMWKRLTEAKSTVAMYEADPMYKNTGILKMVQDNDVSLSEFRVRSFDTLSSNKKSKSGKTYGQLSTYDALSVRAKFFFDSNAGKGFFHALSPTQGDNGNLTVIKVPKYNYTKGVATKPVYKDNSIVSPDIKEWIENQIEGELTRIARYHRAGNIKSYGDRMKSGELITGNGGQFNLFRSLNSEKNKDYRKMTESELKSEVAQLYPLAAKEFITMMEKDVAYMEEKGIYEANKNGSFTAKNKFLDNTTNAEMQTFLANNFIYSYEQMLFYAGDSAFYAQGSVSEQNINLNKRFRLPFTPGSAFAINTVNNDEGLAGEVSNTMDKTEFYSGMPPTFKLKVINEGEVREELSSVYNILGGGFKKNIELADGTGFISMKRHLQSMAARGLLTDDLVNTVTELTEWAKKNEGKQNLDKVEVEGTLEILKHFYFKIKPLSEENPTLVPTSLKYSVVPAIPTLFELKNHEGNHVFPGLAKISEELRSGRADEIVFPSAMKVGVREASAIGDLQNATAIILDNDGMRIPQVSPDQQKLMNRLGSQIRKLIMSNFEKDTKILGLSGTDALDAYNAALSGLASEAGFKVIEEFSNENGHIDKNVIVDIVLKELEYNPHKDGEFYKEALTTLNAEGNQLIPSGHPIVRGLIDATIASRFRKAVAKMKTPGYSAVQMTSYGTEKFIDKDNIGIGSDLNFLGISRVDQNGKRTEIPRTNKAELERAARQIKSGDYGNLVIEPAEVRITPNYFTKRLREIARDKVNRNKINKQVQEFRKGLPKNLTPAEVKLQMDSYRAIRVHTESNYIYEKMFRSVSVKGKLDINRIREAGLDEFVIYRIPTQGKNSMLPVKIKNFLSPTQGNAIQVPAGIVEQSGSDFDIDKVFIEMPNFDYNSKTSNLQKHSYLGRSPEGLVTTDTKDFNIDDFVGDTQAKQAFIMEYHKAILMSPAYASELLLPNNADTLVAMAKELNPTDPTNRDTESSNTVEQAEDMYPSIRAQEEFRNNNKSGGDMIGIASIASVMHTVAQHIGVSFRSSAFIKGMNKGNNNTLILGNTYNIEGTKRISDEIAEIQNAALDNANDPLLGRLNINAYTSGVALLLVSAGHGLEFTTRLLNSPILKELADIYPRYERTLNPEAAHLEAMFELMRKYKLSIFTDEKMSGVLGGLDSNRAKALSTGTTKNDMDVAFNVFRELYTHGQALSRFQAAMNIDSSGTPTTTAGIINRYARLAKIDGTTSNSIELNKGDLGITPILPLFQQAVDPKKLAKIKIDQNKYMKSHLATMETFLLNFPLQVLMQSSPVATQQYQHVLSVASDNLGYFDEFGAVKILAAYDTFLSVNPKATLLDNTTLGNRLVQNYSSMVDSSNAESTGHLLKEHWNTERLKGGPKNMFTKHLVVRTEGGRHFVTFNNTLSSSITKDIRSDMRAGFEQLMESESPADNVLAKSLADYAMIMYGFSRSPNSFMEYLPPSAHTEYMGAEDADYNNLSIPDFFRALDETNRDSTVYTAESINNFVELYMRNNISTINVPYASEASEIYYLQNADSRKPPKYVKRMNKEGEWILRKLSPLGGYSTLPSLGVPNLVQEYHYDANLKSYFNDNSSKTDTSTQRQKDTKENKQTIEDIKNESDGRTLATKGEMLKFFTRYIDSDVTNVTEESAFSIPEELRKNMTADKKIGITDADITFITDRYAQAAKDVKFIYKSKAARGVLGSLTFNELYQSTLDAIYDEAIISQNFDVMEKIINC